MYITCLDLTEEAIYFKWHTYTMILEDTRGILETFCSLTSHDSLLYRAGIGRTGVFIALDILLQELKADERTVDVFAVVAKMRRERCSLVQSLVSHTLNHN